MEWECPPCLQRTDSKEFICLVDAGDWQLRMRIATTTQDLADLAWSPDGSCFVVWDTPLAYKLLVYSAKGHCLSAYSAYQDALGIRSVAWSPSGDLPVAPLDFGGSETEKIAAFKIMELRDDTDPKFRNRVAWVLGKHLGAKGTPLVLDFSSVPNARLDAVLARWLKARQP